MKNYGHSFWVSVYELFNEFFGGLLPGTFFCTYFVLCAIFLTSSFGEHLTEYWHVIIIGIIAISYTMGAIFRASNMRGPDIESARHIYFHSTPTDDNAFAFVETMSQQEYLDLISEIEKNQNLSSILNLKFDKFRRRKKRADRNFRNSRTKSIPYCLGKIYKKALRKKRCLEHTRRIRKDADNKIQELETLIQKIVPYVSFSVDYPYYNLKKYFANRGMEDLAEMVDWDYSASDNKITNRSKSAICDIKLKLRNNQNVDISLITKSEAHIRFMNSMWHASKRLQQICALVSGICFLLLLLRAVVYFVADQFSVNNEGIITDDFSSLSFKNCASTPYLQMLMNFLQRFLYYVQVIVKSKDLFIIFVISIVYLFFCKIIIMAIKNNFHYQRMREITYLFQSYQLMMDLEKNPVKNCATEDADTKVCAQLFMHCPNPNTTPPNKEN